MWLQIMVIKVIVVRAVNIDQDAVYNVSWSVEYKAEYWVLVMFEITKQYQGPSSKQQLLVILLM